MQTNTLQQAWDFSQTLGTAEDSGQIMKQILKISKVFGVELIASGILPSDRSSIIASSDVIFCNWPNDWINRYVPQDYKSVDPVVKSIYRNPRVPIFAPIVELCAEDGPARKRMILEQHDIGILAAYAIPTLRNDGSILVTTFNGRALELSEEKLRLLSIVASLASTKVLEVNRPPAHDRLTQRERDVLLWAAEGKTAWETSEILSISLHTVHQHLKSATAKLGASNRTQAVAAALRAKIIR